MIITLEQLKSALGISGTAEDPLLDQSIAMAESLLNAYIGYPMADTVTVHEYTYSPDPMPHWYYGSSRRNFVHLPLWPIVELVEVVRGDGTTVPALDYRVVKDKGRVDFFSGLPATTDYLVFHYRAGYDPMPADITPVMLNMSAAIYNNGGALSSTSSNALKSLTMFDAMSMSFDTSGESTGGGAMGLLEPWAFVLDKYRVVNQPVLK